MKKRSTAQPNQNYSAREPHTRVSYEFISGLRFNSNVLFCRDEQQFYQFNKTSVNNGHTYRCIEHGCRCRVYILNEECYISNAVAHNHGKKARNDYFLCALNEMRRILHWAHNQLSPKEVFDYVIKRLVDVFSHILRVFFALLFLIT